MKLVSLNKINTLLYDYVTLNVFDMNNSLVAVLNTQIESVIDSLEHNVDLTFPDLLVRSCL